MGWREAGEVWPDQPCRPPEGRTLGGPLVKRLIQATAPRPPVSEATAIVEVRSDRDAELGALEQRRGQTHAPKQGMKQELLTGKTRENTVALNGFA